MARKYELIDFERADPNKIITISMSFKTVEKYLRHMTKSQMVEFVFGPCDWWYYAPDGKKEDPAAEHKRKFCRTLINKPRETLLQILLSRLYLEENLTIK